MIFGTLSNAAYRVSLRAPGAELEGGSQEPPPPSGGKARGPSGRGLKESSHTGALGFPRLAGWWR